MQPPRDRLTVKERVVATLVWEGLTNRDIADRIHTSEQVVKTSWACGAAWNWRCTWPAMVGRLTPCRRRLRR
jgi:FixJ family two-component response regulator